MNLDGNQLFGTNAAVVILVTAFVLLILLVVVIALQAKILKLLSKQSEELEIAKAKEPEVEVKAEHIHSTPVNVGVAKGETKLSGIKDEEHVAVIMAAVSNAANIPLTSLRIKSIKRIDNI